MKWYFLLVFILGILFSAIFDEIYLHEKIRDGEYERGFFDAKQVYDSSFDDGRKAYQGAVMEWGIRRGVEINFIEVQRIYNRRKSYE